LKYLGCFGSSKLYQRSPTNWCHIPMPTQACIQQLDNWGHQTTYKKWQRSQCWLQNEQFETMNLWVVTQCMERVKKQTNNDFERVGKNRASKSLEQWISTCYHGNKNKLLLYL